MKPKLQLNAQQFKNPGSTLGMPELLRGIGESDLFDVSFHDESISTMRGERASLIYYNGKKIYLDLWEYPTPSHTMEVYNANFDLIIKVQHRDISFHTYHRYTTRKRLLPTLSKQDKENFLKKFVPWTFFPSRMMKEFVGQEIVIDVPIERDCFFCGKPWKCRGAILESLKKQEIECVNSDQGLRKGRPLNDKEYLQRMKSSKYGLVLAGRASMLTDSKNRREVDYMMLQKPLVLNYKPFYYNSMVAGKHYILIDQNTQIKTLESMYNIKEIATNGYEWYKQNASPEAIPRTFLQIMQDKFGKESI